MKKRIRLSLRNYPAYRIRTGRRSINLSPHPYRPARRNVTVSSLPCWSPGIVGWSHGPLPLSLIWTIACENKSRSLISVRPWKRCRKYSGLAISFSPPLGFAPCFPPIHRRKLGKKLMRFLPRIRTSPWCFPIRLSSKRVICIKVNHYICPWERINKKGAFVWRQWN